MTQTRTFSLKPESVAAARRFATEALSDLPADLLEAVELMVSELATNCIRHANSPFDLTLVKARGEVRIEVTDRAGGRPELRSPAPSEPSGRGLQIVKMLSETWGVEQRAAAGKTVWFTVAAPGVPATADRG
jgi:anti-sigma regulatory factor (Ser/Thr protein kinase)